MSAGSTIYALSSAPGRAAIAVLRVSGPAAGPAAEALTGRAHLPPRQAVLAKLRAPSGAVLDTALVLWFPAPFSETGEDVAEFQVHGGRAVDRGRAGGAGGGAGAGAGRARRSSRAARSRTASSI